MIVPDAMAVPLGSTINFGSKTSSPFNPTLAGYRGGAMKPAAIIMEEPPSAVEPDCCSDDHHHRPMEEELPQSPLSSSSQSYSIQGDQEDYNQSSSHPSIQPVESYDRFSMQTDEFVVSDHAHRRGGSSPGISEATSVDSGLIPVSREVCSDTAYTGPVLMLGNDDSNTTTLQDESAFQDMHSEHRLAYNGDYIAYPLDSPLQADAATIAHLAELNQVSEKYYDLSHQYTHLCTSYDTLKTFCTRLELENTMMKQWLKIDTNSSDEFDRWQSVADTGSSAIERIQALKERGSEVLTVFSRALAEVDEIEHVLRGLGRMFVVD